MTVRMVKSLNRDLYNRIENLPDDLKTKIYKEYLEPLIKKTQIIHVLYTCNRSEVTYKSQLLLIKLIKNVLNDEDICKYLIKTCKNFETVYSEYSNDNLGFPLITDKYTKFAICLILTTFH